MLCLVLDVNDPLVPVPLDLETYVHGAMADDPNADVHSVMTHYFTQFKIRMAGFDSVGNPIVPPNSHVLDHLARVWDLVDNDTANNRPAANTVACPVDDDIECDLCGAPARYETPIHAGGGKELIYACLDCTRSHGESMLGGGASVFLMYDEEIPAEVRDACDAIRTAQGLGSIWAPDATDDDSQRRLDAEDPLRARIDLLEEELRGELKEVREDVETLTKQFTIDENGNFELTRRVYDQYRRLVGRANKIHKTLVVQSEETPIAEDMKATAEAEPSAATEPPLRQQPRAPALDVKAVSVRLRQLWINEIGPLLGKYDHDLAEVWSALLVRRVGSTLMVSGSVDFGEGDPFDGPAGEEVLHLVRSASEGAVTSISYEYAANGIPKLRSKKTTSIDIFHPDDVTATQPSELAARLASKLSGVGAADSSVLARIRVAGVGKFRTWLAVPTEGDRQAIGSTPGAAADLRVAMNQVEKRDSVYDIVVDPETQTRYVPIEADSATGS